MLAHAELSLSSDPSNSTSEGGRLAVERQDRVPAVTIKAQRQRQLERQAQAFVTRLTHSGRFYGESIALWRVPLCFLVAGLPRTQGELMLGRLSGDADSAGARLAGEHCQPNFLVFLTSEPDSLLKRLKARHPRMLGEGAPAEKRRFMHPSNARAVRIWHNAEVADRYGVPLYEFRNGPCYLYDPGEGCPTHSDIIESRLSWDRLIVFSSAIVVVDTTLARGATFGQLTDYIALVGLADIDPGVDVGDTPTILRLFSAPPNAAPPGLTSWDQAFLRGLYHTDQRGQY